MSVGEADFVKQLLDKLGEVLFWKIAMKPGRPLAYGRLGVPAPARTIARTHLRDFVTATDGAGLADVIARSYFSPNTLPAPTRVSVDLHPALARPQPALPARLNLMAAEREDATLRTPTGVCLARYRIERDVLSFAIDDDCALEQLAQLDVLAVEPDNQRALITLLLALTDQFEQGIADRQTRARALLPRLTSEYERTYYAGLISERRGKAALKDGTLVSGRDIYEWLTEAMALYERAEALCPPGNDEARLRWNACARKLNSNESLRPHDERASVPYHD